MLSCLYFIILIFGTLSSYLFIPSLVIHGRTNSLLPKNLFFVFYAIGLLYLIANKQYSLYMVHLFRRLVECYFFRYKRSCMNVCQFLVGISYYIVMSNHIMNYNLGFSILFLLLNVGQFIAHFFVFNNRKTFFHYYFEIMIYLYLFLKIGTVILLLNLVWIALFVSITIRMRAFSNRSEKKKNY